MTAAHEPTSQSRQLVLTAAGLGLPHRQIGILLGTLPCGKVSDVTLRAHYRDELDTGEAQATFKIAQTLYSRAVDAKDLGAIIFWLKARAGWREKHVLDDPGAVQTLADLVAASGLAVPGKSTPVLTIASNDPSVVNG